MSIGPEHHIGSTENMAKLSLLSAADGHSLAAHLASTLSECLLSSAGDVCFDFRINQLLTENL